MENVFEMALRLRSQGLSADTEEAGRMLLEKALALFQQAVNEMPDDAKRVFYLAMSHDILDMEQEAIPFYHRAIALELPLAQRFEANLYLASSYFNVGKLEQAEHHLVIAEHIRSNEGAVDDQGAFFDIASKIRGR
ncbi:hypothetical protein NIES2135_61230 (plasmid) [Leptolyngbya boryana NIES-2135]|jgi:tetratricopeptide (TPR) repeat protein|uniref:Tetratrico peptide repeat group 5 domain-containing protein n=1 Tax=Leptolyngbya boryana NIES-2135 TaxID=1973484 RepID=A0A1Z4JR97_LEPBY|nr:MULTISPECIES: tetratricopeptide repeat protein [Leptolyngbya]BAY59246.1 hypothetical protein NIES2135_61230 [Leptolyngbya boryana NIES-2135]MBD2372835.1 tetratricopeptide repeat protein [Leptolyngbya sp. FACHB-238]MBD2397412.1 tetratricopeptide repeat protein [Leptolyngbya sp. FACHB-239]MBD2403783.1 tetratricopeptide repeat protein [Leptolyngbya sp. FACHB-402]ULP33439.1 tetratricopeptide repeat protein [Leptolyngbya boryana IU 594]